MPSKTESAVPITNCGILFQNALQNSGQWHCLEHEHVPSQGHRWATRTYDQRMNRRQSAHQSVEHSSPPQSCVSLNSGWTIRALTWHMNGKSIYIHPADFIFIAVLCHPVSHTHGTSNASTAIPQNFVSILTCTAVNWHNERGSAIWEYHVNLAANRIIDNKVQSISIECIQVLRMTKVVDRFSFCCLRCTKKQNGTSVLQ